jgi:hypothetical protein
MSGRKPQKVAEDSSEAIADDSASFEGMLEESSEAARSLQSDWLYQRDGHVFGPVKPKELLEMLYKGEVNGETMVAVEEEEFRPLKRYGVFRAHLPKAGKRLQEVETEKALEKAATKRTIIRRILLVIGAICVLVGGAYWTITYIRTEREKNAMLEKKKKEDALKKQLEDLYASVTIEPPLMPLVEEEEEDKKAGTKAKGRKRGGKAVARFGGTGELKREEVMDGVAKVFGGFKKCIVEQMQRDKDSIPETIVLSFQINNQGKAQNTNLSDRSLRESPMNACMVGTLARAKWREFKGEVQNVEYPITIGRR